MLDDLYSSKLLQLSGSIAHLGRLEAADGTSTRHARLCGSVVSVDVELDDAGRVVRLGQDVRACALGQASAAVMGAGAIGASLDEIGTARDGLRRLLAGEDTDFDPRFDDLAIFASVRDFKARHASVMLAFEALYEAVEKARQARGLTAA